MKLLAATLVSLVTFAAVAAIPQKLEASADGKNVILDGDRLARVGAKTVALVDGLESTPKSKVKTTYTGFPIATVLDLAFGERAKWTAAKEIVFECADGYKAKVPTAELAKRKGFLVYEREGDSTFSLTNNTQAGKRVTLAPYYLVWDDAKMQEPKSAGFWPYQVVAIRIEK